MRYRPKYALTVVAIAFLAVVTACSTKKNTAGSRFWQAFNTRYNVYYNGKTNYDEQLHDMEIKYEDDYAQRLYFHPAEAYANPKAPQPTGSFDRTIEKMQKAIALHSIKKKPKKNPSKSSDPKYKEWLKRDEYNPFMHNAWFTMAKAEYMKGDFTASSATFHYISKHFTWMPDLVLESQLWEAMSYCAMGWTSEADNVLTHIHPEKVENKRLLNLYNLAMANYYVKEKKGKEAIPYLAQAVKGAKGAQATRLNFLLGQLYTEAGENELAYKAFAKAGSSMGASYRTKFNARIKQSAVFAGANIKGEVSALKRMTRFDRNKEYLDQIYYAIGNLYLSRQDTVSAISNYVLAAEKSTRNGIDKAISQLTLGAIYFEQHRYDLAQPCYSEAVPIINEDYPNYKALKRRSDVLDELAVYAQNVTLQDSLLRLSAMSLDEQKAVIKKIIDELKKKEKEAEEDAKREEYLANQAAQGNQFKNNANDPAQFTMNTDNSWYFYNSSTVSAGKTAFQKSWGNRRLEDDWRRRNKAVYSFSEDNDSDDDNTDNTEQNDSVKADAEKLKREEDPHYEEYYLKQIPKTDEERANSHAIIQDGLFNMGLILKDKLEDYHSAINQFNTLLSRYPDNPFRLDTYYNMYLMYMRLPDVAMAEKYRALITTDFAESPFGIAMQDPNYLENLRNMETDQEVMYEAAYNAYLNNENQAVHDAYTEIMRKYPTSKVVPKFMFISALSYVTEKRYDDFKNTLKEMLERYPDTDMSPMASSILKQLAQGRKIEGTSSNVRGMLWSTRLTNDSTKTADAEKQFTKFEQSHSTPHVFVFAYPTDTVSPNKLLFDIARHNFNSFVVKDFDLEQMTFGHIGLLVVKGFSNYAELEHYRTVLENDKEVQLPPQVRKVMISVENFNILLNEGRSLEEYFEFMEADTIEGVEAKGFEEMPAVISEDDDNSDPEVAEGDEEEEDEEETDEK